MRAFLGFAVGRWWLTGASAASLAILVLAAWLGLLVASLLAPVLAGELSLVHGPYIWLVATGGAIQPMAAVLGALIGKASERPETATQPR